MARRTALPASHCCPAISTSSALGSPASLKPVKAPPGGVVARQASVPASHGCPALLILSTDVPPPTAADDCHSSIPLTGVVLKQLSIKTVDSSLKCEIWMLSRVRNYLEDQLLGFALVPLSDVLVVNGKLEKEFSLSSTDIYHSPTGFVQLSLKYSGTSPDVMVITKFPNAKSVITKESETDEQEETSEYDKLEFPDPNIANENQMMVTQYIGINGSSLDSHSTYSPVSSETENQFSSETVVHTEESFSASSQSSETPVKGQNSPKQDEHISPLKEEKKKNDEFTAEHVPNQEKADTEEKEAPFNPVLTINVEPPKETVVQQDIVDMYMKSMQQFTESLAKMKLPMDLGSNSAKSENSSSSDPNAETPKTPGSRVFYGSRAFF